MNGYASVGTRLLIRPAHLNGESLRGYISRLSDRNGSSPLLKPMLESLQTASNAIPEISALTGCDDHLLQEHGSYVHSCIAGGAGVVFGCGVISTKQVRMQSRKVCPPCLRKKDGISTCCWELHDYDVCHMHGCHLVGHCHSCSRPLSWLSSSFGVCSCGVRFADIQTQAASTNRKLFCRLIADAVSKTVTRSDEREFIPGALTPLNWFYIFRNFIHSVLLPNFYAKYLGIREPGSESDCIGLLLAMLSDQEYCRHLRQVIFLHAAKAPMTLARTLRSDVSGQEMVELFKPCLRKIAIHDCLIEIARDQKQQNKVVSRHRLQPGFVPKEQRPESHNFQLQANAFLSAITYAFSDKR